MFPHWVCGLILAFLSNFLRGLLGNVDIACEVQYGPQRKLYLYLYLSDSLTEYLKRFVDPFSIKFNKNLENVFFFLDFS